jgi:hypothetical protein
MTAREVLDVLDKERMMLVETTHRLSPGSDSTPEE